VQGAPVLVEVVSRLRLLEPARHRELVGTGKHLRLFTGRHPAQAHLGVENGLLSWVRRFPLGYVGLVLCGQLGRRIPNL
jgi:hypothetical protein